VWADHSYIDATGLFNLMSAMVSSQGTWWQQPSDRCVKLPSYIGGDPVGSKPCIPIACSTLAMSSSKRLKRQLKGKLQALYLGPNRQMPSGLLPQISQHCLPSTTQRQPCRLTFSLECNLLTPVADQMHPSGGSLTLILLPTSISRGPKQDQAEARVKVWEAENIHKLQSCLTSCKSDWLLFWSLLLLMLLLQSPQ